MASSAVTMRGLPVSPYVQRVAVILHECGVDTWETIPVNPINGETKLPEFLEHNPFGKIPVYQDADVEVYESRTISRYLLEKHTEKGAALLGQTPAERAEVNKWVDVETTSYNIAIAPIIGEALIKKLTGNPVDEVRLKEHVSKLSALLDVYDKQLEGKDYLVLGRLTFADLTHLPHTSMLEAAGFGNLISDRPNVATWWARISSLPSWEKVQEGPTIPKLVAKQG